MIKNRKIILTVGCSGSGKSTWAAQTVQHNPERYVRVNRDDVRNLLFGYNDTTINEYYHRVDIKQRERQVSRYIDTLIYDSLELDKVVICDNTHLKREYIVDYKKWNVPVELEFFDIPLELCLRNNGKRSRRVDEGIIRKQHKQFKSLVSSIKDKPLKLNPFILENDNMKESCYVFDIDGTLAHTNGRSPFDFHKVGSDLYDWSIGNIADALNRDQNSIIIATGRESICKKETENWLKEFGIEYNQIYMRKEKDFRPDWLVKQEMAQEICKNYNIVAWIDDRLQVTRHLRMLGIKVLNVDHGNF